LERDGDPIAAYRPAPGPVGLADEEVARAVGAILAADALDVLRAVCRHGEGLHLRRREEQDAAVGDGVRMRRSVMA